jgi:hypothetical protein
MRAQGWTEQQASSQPAQEIASSTPGNAATAQSAPNPLTTLSGKDGTFKITLPAGWVQTTLPNQSYQLVAKDPAAAAYLIVDSVDAADIQDWQIYAESRKAKLIGNLTHSTSSETQKIKVNGFDALRADFGGVLKNGLKVHYLGTVIKTEKNVVFLLSWTLESQFARNRSEIEGLPFAMQF